MKKNKISRANATKVMVACCLTGGFGWLYAAGTNPRKAVPFGLIGLGCLIFIGIGWIIAIYLAYVLFKASSGADKLAQAGKAKKNKGGMMEMAKGLMK